MDKYNFEPLFGWPSWGDIIVLVAVIVFVILMMTVVFVIVTLTIPSLGHGNSADKPQQFNEDHPGWLEYSRQRRKKG